MASKLIKIFLGPGTLVYPKISKPDTYGEFADNKFKTGIAVDPEHPRTKEAIQLILQMAKDNGIKNIVKSGQSRTVPFDDEDEEHEGKVIFSAKTKDRPAVFDAKNRKLPEGVLIGGGTTANIQVAVNCWLKKVKQKGGGSVEKPWGINLFLNQVQVLDLVEYSSRENSAFEEAEGYSYEGDGNEASVAEEGGADSGGDPDDEIPF